MLMQFLFSSYSDRHGRRGISVKQYYRVYGLCNFSLVDTGNSWLITLAVSEVWFFGHDVWTKRIFTELFSTEVRYSGATLGYQFGAILVEPLLQPSL